MLLRGEAENKDTVQRIGTKVYAVMAHCNAFLSTVAPSREMAEHNNESQAIQTKLDETKRNHTERNTGKRKTTLHYAKQRNDRRWWTCEVACVSSDAKALFVRSSSQWSVVGLDFF